MDSSLLEQLPAAQSCEQHPECGSSSDDECHRHGGVVFALLREAIDGPAFLRACWQVAACRKSIMATDCESLYDDLKSQSSPTLDDKMTSLDIVIIRESFQRMKASFWWLPTDRMIADGLRKESPEALDLMRACLRAGG